MIYHWSFSLLLMPSYTHIYMHTHMCSLLFLASKNCKVYLSVIAIDPSLQARTSGCNSDLDAYYSGLFYLTSDD